MFWFIIWTWRKNTSHPQLFCQGQCASQICFSVSFEFVHSLFCLLQPQHKSFTDGLTWDGALDFKSSKGSDFLSNFAPAIFGSDSLGRHSDRRPLVAAVGGQLNSWVLECPWGTRFTPVPIFIFTLLTRGGDVDYPWTQHWGHVRRMLGAC